VVFTYEALLEKTWDEEPEIVVRRVLCSYENNGREIAMVPMKWLEVGVIYSENEESQSGLGCPRE